MSAPLQATSLELRTCPGKGCSAVFLLFDKHGRPYTEAHADPEMLVKLRAKIDEILKGKMT